MGKKFAVVAIVLAIVGAIVWYFMSRPAVTPNSTGGSGTAPPRISFGPVEEVAA
jgi:hypothetical protein